MTKFLELDIQKFAGAVADPDGTTHSPYEEYLDYDGLRYYHNKIKDMIPKNTSDLANDSGFITDGELAGAILSEDQPTNPAYVLWIEESDLDGSGGGTPTPGKTVTVEDTLASSSSTNALSAKQGKILNETKVSSTSIKNIEMVTEYPANPDPNTLYIRVER